MPLRTYDPTDDDLSTAYAQIGFLLLAMGWAERGAGNQIWLVNQRPMDWAIATLAREGMTPEELKLHLLGVPSFQQWHRIRSLLPEYAVWQLLRHLQKEFSKGREVAA